MMADSRFNLSNLIDSTEWIISWIYTTIFEMMFFYFDIMSFFCLTGVNLFSVEDGSKKITVYVGMIH